LTIFKKAHIAVISPARLLWLSNHWFVRSFYYDRITCFHANA